MVRISWDIAGEINWVILYNMLLCKESLTGHAFQNGMKACTLLDERQVVSPFIASSRLKYRLSHTHLLQALFTNKIIKTQVSGMSFGEWNKIWCKDCYDLPHPPTLFFLWIKKAYFWWITIYHTIKFLSVKSPRPEGTTLFFFYGTPLTQSRTMPADFNRSANELAGLWTRDATRRSRRSTFERMHFGTWGWFTTWWIKPFMDPFAKVTIVY